MAQAHRLLEDLEHGLRSGLPGEPLHRRPRSPRRGLPLHLLLALVDGVPGLLALAAHDGLAPVAALL